MDASRRKFLSLMGGAAALIAVPVDIQPSVATQLKGVREATLTFNARGMHSFVARYLDGTLTRVYFRDCGDVIPGYDGDGNVWECFTTHFKCDRFEEYCQVDKSLLELSPNPNEFRMAEDMALLTDLGLDVGSIDWGSIGVDPGLVA